VVEDRRVRSRKAATGRGRARINSLNPRCFGMWGSIDEIVDSFLMLEAK
jgi:hypothetical protein